jgi:phenylalanine-4-hydroxylase
MTTLTMPLIEQNWAAYTAEDHEVWGLLYAKRMRELEKTGARLFLEGAAAIGLDVSHVPDLEDVNFRLASRTGWQAVPVGGFIPAADFFTSLSMRRFPTTIIIRPKSQLDYLP